MVRILNGSERGVVDNRGYRLEPSVLGFGSKRNSTLNKMFTSSGGSIVKTTPLNKRSSQIEKMGNSIKGARSKDPYIKAKYPTKVITTRRLASKKPRKTKSSGIYSGGGLSTGAHPLVSGRASNHSGQNRMASAKQGLKMLSKNSLISKYRL